MWLIIVIIVGTLIILLELSLAKIILWLESHNIIRTSTVEWFGNDTLQLQRMAHEELGLGNWSGCHGEDIPVTRKGQLLGIFDLTDPDHPKLVNPRAITQKPEGSTNIDESGDPEARIDGSETVINESPLNASSPHSNHSSVNETMASDSPNAPNDHPFNVPQGPSHAPADQGRIEEFFHQPAGRRPA